MVTFRASGRSLNAAISLLRRGVRELAAVWIPHRVPRPNRGGNVTRVTSSNLNLFHQSQLSYAMNQQYAVTIPRSDSHTRFDLLVKSGNPLVSFRRRQKSENQKWEKFSLVVRVCCASVAP